MIDPDTIDWETPLAENWREVEEWLDWYLRALPECDSILNGARADLNILSQVTPRHRKPRLDYDWLLSRAISMGAKVTGIGSAEWDISGDCSYGYHRPFTSWPSYDAKHRRKRNHKLHLVIITRCRKCVHCLRHRSRLWRVRAVSEVEASVRTWFGTLTLDPAVAFQWRLQGSDLLSRRYPYSDAKVVGAAREFQCIHEIASREVTKALKRFRKKHGLKAGSFKYLIVAEAHKSGVPHYHLLIHEKASDRPIRYEELRTFWPHGFYQYRLVKELHEATYLCKYLSKDMRARVRASQSYGQTPSLTINLPDGRGKFPAKGSTRHPFRSMF